jgi:hypothetical protein
MNALFYNRDLGAKIPCTIIPGQLNIYDSKEGRVYLCPVSFDNIDLTPYGITIDQINKYCQEYVNLHDLYPAEVQSDIDYFNSCIDTKSVDILQERTRFEKLYNIICSQASINTDLIYNLCNFIITDLQFRILTHNENIFMRSLSDILYTTKPDPIPVIEFVRMIKMVFDKYTGDEVFSTHNIQNIGNRVKYAGIFPITLNVTNIQENVNFLLA